MKEVAMNQTEINENVERVMLSGEQIGKRVKEVAAQLNKLYEGRRPLVVCILKGSVIFFTDLIRHMDMPLEIDFMAVSSYGNGTKSGQLKVTKDLTTDISGRDVLIVEDIIDSGNTLYNLKKTAQFPFACQCEHRDFARQTGAPGSADGAGIYLFCDRRRVCGRLRHGLRGGIPQPAVHRGIEAFRL